MEEFFSQYQHTIAAFGVFGTIFAVLVSLYMGYVVLDSQRCRIKVFVQEKGILYFNDTLYTVPIKTHVPGFKERYVVASITNVGLIPVGITGLPAFCFAMPLVRKEFLINPIDASDRDVIIPKKQYPCKLEPKSSQDFFLMRKDQLEDNIRIIAAQIGHPALIYFFKVLFRTDDGKIFKAKIAKELKMEIKNEFKKAFKAKSKTIIDNGK